MAKHPGGRPPKYNSQFHPLIAASLKQNGLTEQESADRMGIAMSTFSLWKIKYPEFSEAIKNVKQELIGRLEHALYKRAEGFEVMQVEGKPDPNDPNGIIPIRIKKVYFPPDTGALAFSLKNLDPKNWRDKHEFVGEDGKPIEIKVINTDDRISEILATLEGVKGRTAKKD
jgi:transcriptional regulator with XRE-family HTH domain